MLNPVHLRTLATVLRCGSFADAARQLGYTPSAVSQQISTLERQLKVALFERDARSIRATPAAEFIVENSSAALGSLRTLEDDISLLLGGVIGRIRVGSFPPRASNSFPPHFRRSSARTTASMSSWTRANHRSSSRCFLPVSSTWPSSTATGWYRGRGLVASALGVW